MARQSRRAAGRSLSWNTSAPVSVQVADVFWCAHFCPLISARCFRFFPPPCAGRHLGRQPHARPGARDRGALPRLLRGRLPGGTAVRRGECRVGLAPAFWAIVTDVDLESSAWHPRPPVPVRPHQPCFHAPSLPVSLTSSPTLAPTLALTPSLTLSLTPLPTPRRLPSRSPARSRTCWCATTWVTT